jgi:hypothetical protein
MNLFTRIGYAEPQLFYLTVLIAQESSIAFLQLVDATAVYLTLFCTQPEVV